MSTPEARARVEIDRLLTAAGWYVCDLKQAGIHGARDVAIREFPLEVGRGDSDYLLYVDDKGVGVIKDKKRGATLTGVQRQSARYSQGLPAALAVWARPLVLSPAGAGQAHPRPARLAARRQFRVRA